MGRLSANWLKDNGYARFQVLVETGGGVGSSAKYCAALFPEVHTIELGKVKFAEARAKLRNYPNVRCHRGSSPKVLPKILDPRKSTLLWLDAHFVATDPNSAGTGDQCALLGELDALFAVRWQAEMVALIDDAHMFQPSFWRQRWAKPYDIRQWPREEALRAKCEQSGYRMRHEADIFVVEKAG